MTTLVFNIFRKLSELLIFYIFIISCQCTVQRSTSESDECEYSLSVNNDGPVTLDVPITFFVFLTCASPEENYIYIFEDNANPQHKIKVKGNNTAMASFVYPESLYESDVYSVKVSAFVDMPKPFFIQVATKNVTFFVSKYITGVLTLSNSTKRIGDDESLYISTGKLCNISVSLCYPQKIIENIETSYFWMFGDDRFVTGIPYIMYNFSHPRIYKIEVSVIARIPEYDQKSNCTSNVKYKWSYMKKKVFAKDPVHTLNLTGNTYLQHGQLFNLDVSCNGSGPFEYCWKIFLPNENISHMACTDPVVITKCSFPIIYYFHDSGNYQIAIYVDNYVAAIQRNIEVHIYDVSLQPQLSTVIIPLICTVLVISIIAAGIFIHVRQNQTFDVETADFDFIQSETFVIETFWEKLYHSLLQLLYIRSRFQNYYLYLESAEKSHALNQYGSVSE